jgi:hypothetical protein
VQKRTNFIVLGIVLLLVAGALFKYYLQPQSAATSPAADSLIIGSSEYSNL